MKRMTTLLGFFMFSFSENFAMEKTEEKKKIAPREVFLELCKVFMDNYIQKNDIKLDLQSKDSTYDQWEKKFGLFKERLEKVKPIYERWKKLKIRENPLWSSGGGDWLLVFVELKPRYEYHTFDTQEKEFLNTELANAPWIEKYVNKDDDFCIEAKEIFFEKDFIKKYMQLPYEKNKEAIYYGLTPDVFHLYSVAPQYKIVDEGKKIKNGELIFGPTNLNNSCSLLIPGITLISYQTPYTILYGRLIQYTLVYLESIEWYKRMLLRKIQYKNLYKDSWLRKQYSDFYQDPLKYDTVYQKYQNLNPKEELKNTTNITKKDNIDQQSQQQNQGGFWSRVTTGVKNIWTSYKNWIFGGTAVAVGSYALWKYFGNQQINKDKLSRKN